MGVKLRGVIRCGRCRKPRGIRHTCVARAGARRGKTRLQSPVQWECPACHKPRGLRHTCGNAGDFKVRKRKAATRKRQARRKRRRKAAADRRRERRRRAAAERRERERQRKRQHRRQPRPRGESHEPGSCGDRDCEKYRCVIYWRGMDDCPGPHDGG
jgi:hypothetical protein